MTDPLLRPQPLGLYPMPVGGLLLPDLPAAEAAAEALLKGAAIPGDAPAELAFLRCAHQGDPTAAAAALAALGDDPVLDFNRFVLMPDEEQLGRLRARLTGPLASLLECIAYAAGLLETAPAPAPELDGELRAFALTCLASQEIEQGRLAEAAAALGEAAGIAASVSPGQSAQATLSRVEVDRLLRGHDREQVEWLQAALQQLEGTSFDVLRAEVQLELATAMQEAPHPHGQAHGFMGSLPLLQDCLRVLDRETHRRAFGFAQTRLGLAYLSMPMRTASDALRMGVAVQALREATETLEPEADRDLWIPAAINLANAYQLLPSNHQEKNLDGAMALYSRVLELRNAHENPVGHARVRLNRAHALATLGRREDALEDVRFAAAVFGEHGRDQEREAAQELATALEQDQATGPGAGVEGGAAEDASGGGRT